MVAGFSNPPTERKEEYVRQLFDDIAEEYDSMNRLVSAGMWGRWHRKFAARTGFRPGDRILDVACGTGDLTMLAASQVAPGGEVIGVDISQGMLEVARRRVSDSPLRDIIKLQTGNAMALEFPDDSFDGVTMGWAMRNVSSIPKTLSEIYRVLKPGGRFILLEAARPKSWLVRAGFFLYWRTILPALDWVVARAGQRELLKPYTYLSHSLDNYPSPDGLKALFGEAGFVQTDYQLLMFGAVAIHVGTKPGAG